MDNKKFKKAFTLAEVLMTLTIIGVIAAMTIPTLKSHSDEASLIAQTKKAYLSATSALNAAEAKYGDLELWNWSGKSENLNATVQNYFKEVMQTTSSNSFNAYSTNTLGGGSWSNITPTSYFETTDGMLWSVRNFSDKDYKDKHIYGLVFVDVNNTSGPNTVGVDIHAFTITNEGITPMGDSVHDENKSWACTAYVIKHGKMPWYSDSSYTSCADVYGK